MNVASHIGIWTIAVPVTLLLVACVGILRWIAVDAPAWVSLLFLYVVVVGSLYAFWP